MRLFDLLLEVKFNCNQLVVTSDTDGNWGVENFREGKFFNLGNDLFNVRDDEKLMKYLERYEYPKEFYEKWLDRPVLDVELLINPLEIRRYAESNYQTNNDPQTIINVCVVSDEDDDDLFDSPEEQYLTRFPFEKEWPYTLSEEKFWAIKKIFDTKGPLLFDLAMQNILINGLNWAANITDEDIEEARREDEEIDRELERKTAEDPRGIKHLRGDKGLRPVAVEVARDIAMYVQTIDELKCVIKLESWISSVYDNDDDE